MERLPLGLRSRGRDDNKTMTPRDGRRSPHSVRSRSRSPSVPTIVVDDVGSRERSPSTTSTVGENDLTLQVRLLFEKGAVRDTYQSAATEMGNLIISLSVERGEGEEGDIPQHLYTTTLDMVKQTRGCWGIRFSCWSVTMWAEYFPRLAAVNFTPLAAGTIPSLLMSAEREEDVSHVGDFIQNILPLVADSLRHDPTPSDDLLIEGMRYFHRVVSPLVPLLSSNGADQHRASVGLRAVLLSSEDPLCSTSGSIYGPINGEADDVIIPLFDIISSMFRSFDIRVFPEAQPSFLQLFEVVLDTTLTLSSGHSQLFAVGDLLPLRYEEVLHIVLKLLKHKNWKVRQRAVDVFTTLTEGRRWRAAVPPSEGEVVLVLKEMSKTDRIQSVRQRCRSAVDRQPTDGCPSCGAVGSLEGAPFCGQCGAAAAAGTNRPPTALTQLQQMLTQPDEGMVSLHHFNELFTQLPPREGRKLLLDVARRVGWSDETTEGGNGNTKYFLAMVRHSGDLSLSEAHISLLLDVLQRCDHNDTRHDIDNLLVTLRQQQQQQQQQRSP